MPSNQSLLDLFDSYSTEFSSQLRRINSFVTHPTAVGTSHEGILRRFLQRYIPKRMAVSEGFIIGEQENVSNQCDIIIWSHLDYSPIFQEGDFVIVPVGAVKAVIEIKTKLNKKNLYDAFKNLNSVYEMSDEIYTAIFGFESVQPETILKHIANLDQSFSNVVHSIYGRSGWYLQRTKNIKFDIGNNRTGILMETRPTELKKFTELLPFTVFLMPNDRTIARGFTQFLAFLFSSMDLTSPINSLAGPKSHGFLFPGYGIKLFTDCFSCEDERDDFLKDSDLKDYFMTVQNHMKDLEIN